MTASALKMFLKIVHIQELLGFGVISCISWSCVFFPLYEQNQIWFMTSFLDECEALSSCEACWNKTDCQWVNCTSGKYLRRGTRTTQLLFEWRQRLFTHDSWKEGRILTARKKSLLSAVDLNKLIKQWMLGNKPRSK